jgi:hypothetical protein
MTALPKVEIAQLTQSVKDVAGWFSRYELAAKMCNWVKVEGGVDARLEYLPMYLDGQPLVSFKQLPESVKKSYEGVKSALITRYGQKPLVAYKEFVSAKFARGQSLDGFIDELRTMLDNVVNIPNASKDALVLNQFLLSIPEEACERLQMICEKEGKLVLTDVIEKARTMTIFNTPPPLFAAPTVPRGSPKKNPGKPIAHDEEGISTVRCFNCNGRGHFAKDCPKPPKRQKNAQSGAPLRSSH